MYLILFSKDMNGPTSSTLCGVIIMVAVMIPQMKAEFRRENAGLREVSLLEYRSC